MTWIDWLILSVFTILCLGPLRRHLAQNWGFGLPFCLGFVFSMVFMALEKTPNNPWWLPVTMGLFVGLGAGASFKHWFDELFEKEE